MRIKIRFTDNNFIIPSGTKINILPYQIREEDIDKLKNKMVEVKDKPPTYQDIMEIGNYLHRCLFPPNNKEALSLLLEIKNPSEVNYIYLLFDSPTLANYPWEITLDDNQRFLALENNICFPIRSQSNSIYKCNSTKITSLNLLIGIASPINKESFDTLYQKDILEEAAENIRKEYPNFPFNMKFIHRTKIEDIYRNIHKDNYHILFLICPGEFTSKGQGVIYLEDSGRKAHLIDANLLQNNLPQEKPIFIILNGVGISPYVGTHQYLGFPQSLLSYPHISGILMLQFEIAPDKLHIFTKIYLEEIIKCAINSKPIEEAIRDIRIAVRRNLNENFLYWAAPVLYLQENQDKPLWNTLENKILEDNPLEDKPLWNTLEGEKENKKEVLITKGEFYSGIPKKAYLKYKNYFPFFNWKKVNIDYDYFIDIYPVTNEEYKKFIDATGHPSPKHWINNNFPSNKGNYPVTNVTFYDAQAYAKWAGKRLPTKDEWEKAARGGILINNKKNPIPDRIYPWGDVFNINLCNTYESNIGEVTPVDKYLEGRSPYGCFDMVGNTLEWTKTPYDDENYYIVSGDFKQTTEIIGIIGVEKFAPPDIFQDNLGFRCVRDV